MYIIDIMGQTPSKDKQFAELYSSYIQQQQDMIYQQQQQINTLTCQVELLLKRCA